MVKGTDGGGAGTFNLVTSTGVALQPAAAAGEVLEAGAGAGAAGAAAADDEGVDAAAAAAAGGDAPGGAAPSQFDD